MHDVEQLRRRVNSILELLAGPVSEYTDKLLAHVTLARRFAGSVRWIDIAIRIDPAKRVLGDGAPAL